MRSRTEGVKVTLINIDQGFHAGRKESLLWVWWPSVGMWRGHVTQRGRGGCVTSVVPSHQADEDLGGRRVILSWVSAAEASVLAQPAVSAVAPRSPPDTRCNSQLASESCVCLAHHAWPGRVLCGASLRCYCTFYCCRGYNGMALPQGSSETALP
ncbi:hypothetical protein E2C01_029415 [Portunus trituberculatus]|uniref:Uncharacterized protein n=1 Tax=Portunus trituberculatus TaxID=210409 RepID=A0A5B7EUJ1_PORTR|nr:hypothetical protein [Portunus trituberculatus]